MTGRKVTHKDAAQASAVLDASRKAKTDGKAPAAIKTLIENTDPAKNEGDFPEAAAEVARKRAAKQVIGRRFLDAIAAEFGADDEETRKVVSHWMHHVNAGKDGDSRYWPAALPKPDRSDWR